MYAVIKTGGKQYKVAAGEKIKVEQISADIGAGIEIDQVLGGASVSAVVLSQGRHKKVRIFKMRRRKHYQKRQGHRQNYTELFITQVSSELGTAKAEAPAAA